MDDNVLQEHYEDPRMLQLKPIGKGSEYLLVLSHLTRGSLKLPPFAESILRIYKSSNFQ